MRVPIFATAALAALSLASFAGSEVAPKSVAPPSEFPFEQGNTELEIGVGAFGSIGTHGDASRPDVGIIEGEIRYGWMVSTPRGSGFFRGNTEVLLQAYGAGINEGPGAYIGGIGVLLRYNFVQPQARIVPFLQLEGGGAYSDMADASATQRLLGSDFSFTFGGELGVRWMVSRKLAITTGIEYRHTSNADTADRNCGLNVLGGTIGLSLFY